MSYEDGETSRDAQKEKDIGDLMAIGLSPELSALVVERAFKPLAAEDQVEIVSDITDKELASGR